MKREEMNEPLVEQRPSVLRTTASYIIATEFCERLAYYGFAGSLVLFFETQLNMSNEDSVNAFYLWNGAVYVTPLLGGYVADTWLGRYTTILAFAIVYLGGLALFLFGSIPGSVNAAVVFMGMYVVALGAGGIKPNCSTMGADQFDLKIAQDASESKKFFSYFYWSINLGSLLAYSLVAYICQYGLPGLGGAKWGFFVGYLIPTVMLGMGIAVFVSGSKKYKKFAPSGSMVSRAVGIMYEAAIVRRSYRTSDCHHWLDVASVHHGGSYENYEVESVKYVVRLFPFLGVMIPYWGIYGQTKTAFQLQGCQMNSKIGSFQLPISAMNIFNNLSILILVPIFEQYLYPYIRSTGYNLSMLRKMGYGFIFATSAMIMAALIEIYRIQETPADVLYINATQADRDNISPCKSIDNYDPYNYQKWYNDHSSCDKPLNCWQICDTTSADDGLLLISCIECDVIPQMSKISIFWQIPQFVLIGISEIFASITSLEFFYSQAPQSMRSVSQALNLFTNALGSWLTIPLTMAVNADPNDEWIPQNIDEGHLDWYFYLLAGLMFAGFLIFVYLTYSFTYVLPEQLEKLNAQSAPIDDDNADAGQGLMVNNVMNDDNLYAPVKSSSSSNHEQRTHRLVSEDDRY